MKNTLLLILIISISGVIHSQNQVLFNQTKSESFVVKYSADPRAKNANMILDKIASGVPKSVYSTQFVFTYNQNSMIIKNPNKLDLDIEMDEIVFTGDIYYKGFPMADVLLPKSLDLKVNLVAYINQVIQAYEFSDVQLNGFPVKILEQQFNDTMNLTSCKLDVISKNFFYNALNVQNFNNKCFDIDDYYNTDTQMQIAHTELQSINLNNLDMLFEYKKITDKNAGLLNQIAMKKFPEKLSLNTFDPAQFQQKYSDLFQMNSQMSVELNNTIQNLHQIYYTKGLEFLTQGKEKEASLFFNKSINSNLMFAPAHYQLAKIDFNHKNYSQSLQRLQDILYKMQPDQNTFALCNELAKMLFEENLKIADEYNKKSYFDQAIEALQFAESVCKSISGVFCSSGLTDGYVKSYKGKLDEYCTKAYKATEAGAYKDAEDLIKTGELLISGHTTYFPDREVLNNTILYLYNKYISDGTALNVKADYTKALERYESAKKVCENNKFIVCSPDIDKGIYQAKNGIYLTQIKNSEKSVKTDPYQAENLLNSAIAFRTLNNLEKSVTEDQVLLLIKGEIYNKLIEKGKNMGISKLYTEALVNYDQAKEIEKNYAVKKDPQLNTNIKNCARALCILEINNGTENAKKNDLKSARDNYNQANNLITRYQLEKENDINKLLITLKEMIFTQECKNAQAEYDSYYNKGMENVKAIKYIDADNHFNSAIEVSEKNADCGISTDNSVSKKKEILAGVIYQKKLDEILKLKQIGKHKEIVEKYVEAEKFYNGNNVSSLNIMHTELFDFIKKDDNERFVDYGVGYYTGLKDFDKALILLDELKDRDYNHSFTKENQLILGTELAIRDHKSNPQAISKNLVLNYTKGDKWYKNLKKSYLSQWKKL